MEAILASSNSTFCKSTQNQSSLKEPRRPWWNKSCQAAVFVTKKGKKEWRRSPLSLVKRTAWKKAEAVKKKNDQQRKKQAWSSFISSPPHSFISTPETAKGQLGTSESHGRQRYRQFCIHPPITQFLNHTFSPTSKIAPQTTSTPCSPHPN